MLVCVCVCVRFCVCVSQCASVEVYCVIAVINAFSILNTIKTGVFTYSSPGSPSFRFKILYLIFIEFFFLIFLQLFITLVLFLHPYSNPPSKTFKKAIMAFWMTPLTSLVLIFHNAKSWSDSGYSGIVKLRGVYIIYIYIADKRNWSVISCKYIWGKLVKCCFSDLRIFSLHSFDVYSEAW